MLIKSLRELAESGGSNLVTIEKYVRQSFAGAAEVNLTKLLRFAAHKAVAKVSVLSAPCLPYLASHHDYIGCAFKKKQTW